MNFKKTGILLLVMSVLWIAAAGGVLRAEENAKAQGTLCPKKVAVTIETVRTGVLMEYQYFAGQGHAEIVAVKSPVGGMLSEVKVSEGSLVDAGQDLAVMNAGMSDKIKELEAAAAKAKKILTARQGWKEKSEKAVQSATTEYQKALDQLNNAKAQASLIVKAPVPGIAHLVMAAGSEIASDALLLEITNPLQMIFPIPLTASDKGSLAIGDKFIGTTEGFSGEVPAEVAAVGDDQVAFRVNNDDSQFREGVSFTFKRLKAEHADSIVIPSAAVQKDSLGEFIYTAEKNKARKIYVTIGASGEGKTMVEKGLNAGTSLVVSGFDCLVDGKKISIVNEEELAKEKAEAQAERKEKEAKEAAAALARQEESKAKQAAAEAEQKEEESKKAAVALAKQEEDKVKKEAAEAKKLKKELEKKAKADAAAARAAEKNEAPVGKKALCPKKVAVVLETVKTGVFLEYQYYAGQGQSEIAAVKSPVSGMLSEFKVSEGSLVDAGQDLAVMNAGMNDKIKELEAAVAKAKKILTSRQGWKEKSEKAIQSAEQEYQKALDQLNNAKALAGLVIKAPVAGIVHLVTAAGSEIAADTLLLEITNPLQMIFPIPLTASDKGSLAIGDKFIGSTEGFSGEVAAEVSAVSDSQVQFRVNNVGSQFREGVRFTFKRLKAEHAEAVVIPSSAVQKDSLGEFIYLAEKKKARKMYVTLGASSEGKTMVEKGLGTGTPLIVSGFDCLADGKKIRVVNEEELAKETAEAEAKLKEKEAAVPEVKAETPVPTEKPAVAKVNRFRVGLTFGRFSVNDKNLRSFYSDWFKNIPGIEVSVHTLYNIDIWASYKIFKEERMTTYYANPVKFKMVPLSVGLRYRFPKWRFLEPFVGAGLNFYSYKETIEGESPLEDTNGSASGFHFQGGTYLHMKHFRNLQGEIFFKYNMVKKTLDELLPDGTDQLDLGGLEAGVGIVIRF